MCVDLDGTLVNTDTLVESVVLLLKRNPLFLFAMLVWLLAGKANLKENIASRVKLNATTLPYNRELLDWLRGQRNTGRSLVLVTAANQRIADSISDHVGIFSRVIASSAARNLGGGTKRDELVRQFGVRGYDYVGNSRDDLLVWSCARRAIPVNASAGISARAAKLAEVEASFPREHNPLKALISAMRPYQWSKNLLVFVSIVIAQTFTDMQLLATTLIAFISFCLCSSAVYLINDLLDLEADRDHSMKHNRPFACGRAPLMLGVLAVPLLLVASISLAWIAGELFVAVLSLYFVLTIGYSFYFKRVALLDVLILAVLYTLRLIAGAALAVAMPSVWLVTFSVFIFTSLAMAKRYAELKALEFQSVGRAGGRGYNVSDIAILGQLGVASGYVSTLVLALYIDSRDVLETFQNEKIMWLLCPLLMYWIGRIWLIASRGELHQDPVVFATRDRISYIVLALGIVVIITAAR